MASNLTLEDAIGALENKKGGKKGKKKGKGKNVDKESDATSAERVDMSEESLEKMLEFGTKKPLPKFIKLASGEYMVLRIRPIVLRIHSSKKKEAHEGIYSELLLYLP